MYSPQIQRHTPALYRIGKSTGKPMTQVADDLLQFALGHLEEVYPPGSTGFHETNAHEAPSRSDPEGVFRGQQPPSQPKEIQ